MQVVYYIRATFEILVLWVLFYQLYRAFKDSRGAAILGGLLAIVVLGGFLLELAHAVVLKQIAGAIVGPGTILIVLFQPELRTALAKLGSHPFLGRIMGRFLNNAENRDFISEVIDSISYLVSKRYGALIAICRKDKLSEYTKTGTSLDASYSRELIGTIFMPKTLLHDGAVIVDNERIVTAASILPVSNRELKDLSMGLRHRAGIGLAENSDAIVIIVSEETGTVSLVVGNMIQRDINLDLLKERLTQLLYTHETPGTNKDSLHA